MRPNQNLIIMPYREVYIKPKRFLIHKGVAIYHTYKDDDINQGESTFYYTTNPYGSTGEPDEEFDARCLPNAPSYVEGDDYACQMNQTMWDHPPFMGADTPENQTPENKAKWTEFWNKGGYVRQARRVIKEAIDLGHIKPYTE